ncbi:MAG: ferritin family protein [Deltaproteobacteria bacterium]|nr:ferritin family protein [Deltaproteobacteria bacterium]
MKDRLDALDIALTNELREYEFYKMNAERTDNPLGKAMFEAIAKDELEHYEKLKEIYKVWEKNNTWPETIPLKVNKTNVQNVLKDVLQKVAEAPHVDMDDLDAVRTAIAFECDGVMYYELLKESSTEPNEKAFFNLMASIEHEHFVSLKDTEELMVDPAAWFRMRERGGLDGA